MSNEELVKVLAGLRRQAEQEAEVSCLNIDTSLGLALSDVCDALGLKAEHTQEVLGDAAYQMVYDAGIPVMLPQVEMEVAAPAV